MSAAQTAFRWCSTCGGEGIIQLGRYPDGEPRYHCRDCILDEIQAIHDALDAPQRHPSAGRDT